MDGQTDVRAYGWMTDGQTDGRTDGRAGGRMDDGWMGGGWLAGWLDGWMAGRVGGRTFGLGWVGGRADGRSDGRTDERTNERTNERLVFNPLTLLVCCLQNTWRWTIWSMNGAFVHFGSFADFGYFRGKKWTAAGNWNWLPQINQENIIPTGSLG